MRSTDRPGKDEKARHGRAPSPPDSPDPAAAEAGSAAGEGPVGSKPAGAAGPDPVTGERDRGADSTLEKINDPDSEESRIADEFLRKWQSASGLADAPFDFEGKVGPAGAAPADPRDAAGAEGVGVPGEGGSRKKRKGGLLERLQGEQLRQAEARGSQLEEAIRTLEEKLRAQEALVQKHYEARLRVQADLENHKKRVARDKEEIIQYGTERLIKDLLPFVDNLERALDHARRTNDSGPMVEGVKITLNQLLGALSRHGIEPFESECQPFDPQRHEAMSQVETADVAPNTVMEQFQRGYLLWKRLLRPAMVSVSKPPAADPAAAPVSASPAEMIERPASESGVEVAEPAAGSDEGRKTEIIPLAEADERPEGVEERPGPTAPSSEGASGGQPAEEGGSKRGAGDADEGATGRGT